MCDEAQDPLNGSLVLSPTLSQLSPGQRLLGRAEAQLPADHAGCRQVPQVVAHAAPLALPQHLDTTLPKPGARLQTG